MRVPEFDSLEHFEQELMDYLDYYNNRRIKANQRACRLHYTDNKPSRSAKQIFV
jgi:hypothetical protein